ncbi:MAG: hypothetical protein JWO80_3195, partial [Bryobacterales bacterium]|nr:hypothetical protein [Bryobacterales bacterium]
REAGEAVGAGGGDGDSGFAEQLQRYRMSGHAKADGGEPGGDDDGDGGMFPQDEREGSGPVVASKCMGRTRPFQRERFGHFQGGHVDDERAGLRAVLTLVDLRDGGRIERIGAEPVHSFGGKSYEASGA